MCQFLQARLPNMLPMYLKCVKLFLCKQSLVYFQFSILHSISLQNFSFNRQPNILPASQCTVAPSMNYCFNNKFGQHYLCCFHKPLLLHQLYTAEWMLFLLQFEVFSYIYTCSLIFFIISDIKVLLFTNLMQVLIKFIIKGSLLQHDKLYQALRK